MNSKTRIIIETSTSKKSAVTEAADLQGDTLSNWFNEQVFLDVSSNEANGYNGQECLLDPATLNSTDKVFSNLEAIDWAFTDADTQYLTHDLHPYPAKFIPQIPANLIPHLSMPGDLVCDPFGGSATTAVEAVRLGRRAVSIDANPLSELIGKVKTGFMLPETKDDLEQLLATIEGHILSPEIEKKDWAKESIKFLNHMIPEITNHQKWFCEQATAELALIRRLIEMTTSGLATSAALLSLSRIIIRASNQESETRYVSVDKKIEPKFCLKAYHKALKTVVRRLELATSKLQYADAKFLVGDSRFDLLSNLGENSVDLVVTSPPYPNATDYHLYHRFRLFWLGFDPRDLGKIEIGSHLRHQRNDTGFEEYSDDMSLTLKGINKILLPGRYAVFVVGDALFKGKNYSTADAICEIADSCGMDVIGTINRPIHLTRRSFTKAGRRARNEQLVLLRKPNKSARVHISPPAYKMWPYENTLRKAEIAKITGKKIQGGDCREDIEISLKQPQLWHLRRLTFSRDYAFNANSRSPLPTWQKVLENGNQTPEKRKDPKYVTHGIHPFKGKFYPQLAKSLINISGISTGDVLLDPYCGSGTALLEGMLNGYQSFGCDFNPLATRISKAKTSILTLPRETIDHATVALIKRTEKGSFPIDKDLGQFSSDIQEELHNWFPAPVLYKLNWIISQIRILGDDRLVCFFEIILSSLIRDVSQQDPNDLRIRRRKDALKDADVLGIFSERLRIQHTRLKKYWSIAGQQPGHLLSPKIVCGDSRAGETFSGMGLSKNSVDCVVTSPPYATALPYIDTDRLSLLVLMGIPSRRSFQIEGNLTGSREIQKKEKTTLEEYLMSKKAGEDLPKATVKSIRDIHVANLQEQVGFRRANMASLLWRYFIDMRENLNQMRALLKPKSMAFYVVGDSRTKAGKNWVAIETCKHITEIGKMLGFEHVDSIPISVTTENYRHIKNAITENQILVFRKP